MKSYKNLNNNFKTSKLYRSLRVYMRCFFSFFFFFFSFFFLFPPIIYLSLSDYVIIFLNQYLRPKNRCVYCDPTDLLYPPPPPPPPTVNVSKHFPKHIYKQSKNWWLDIKSTKFAEAIGHFSDIFMLRNLCWWSIMTVNYIHLNCK